MCWVRSQELPFLARAAMQVRLKNRVVPLTVMDGKLSLVT